MSGAFVTFSKIGEKEGDTIEIPFARVVGEFDFYTTDMSSYFGMPYILQIKIQQNACKKCEFFVKHSTLAGGVCLSGKITEDSWVNFKSDELSISYGGDGCFSVGEYFGCIHHKIKK